MDKDLLVPCPAGHGFGRHRLLCSTAAASPTRTSGGTCETPKCWCRLTPSSRHDFYSFTAAGSRWINEAWLGELPYYFGWRWLGIRGIYLVMLIETELILLGVFALAQLSSGNVKASFVASWLAVWLATVSFGPRTLLAGWMCLVAELFLLEQFRQGKDWIWCLVPLFMLWANLHGSWLIGMVLFGVFCACGLLHGDGDDRRPFAGRCAVAQACAGRRTERCGIISESLHLSSRFLPVQFRLPAETQCRPCRRMDEPGLP